MGNNARVVILAEDQQHQVFVYGWLRARGFGVRDIRQLPLPAGRGAGEQYVRRQYPLQVREHRRRAASMACWLVAVIDADTLEVRARESQLDAALVDAGLPMRSAGETLCVLIPKRNIETWIHFFSTGSADEDVDYKRPAKTSEECRAAAQMLANTFQEEVPPPSFPPSLQQGWRELKRTFSE